MAPMSEAVIRALLCRITKEADPQALVHDFDPYDEDPDKHLAMLNVGRHGSGVHAWIVTGTPIQSTELGYDEEAQRYAKLWRYTYELEFLYQRDDQKGTAKIALALAIEVMHALDRSAVLHGTEGYQPPTPPGADVLVIQPTPNGLSQLSRLMSREFGSGDGGTVSTICHRFVVTQPVTELTA